MMPWNRKELWMGDSMQQFAKVKDMMRASGIPYDDTVKSASGSDGRGLDARTSGGIASRYGENVKVSNLYYIYVHKYEYEKAAHLLDKMMRAAR